jgi:ubiquinone/menaquinone biosynthesis C-methylase UbiE
MTLNSNLDAEARLFKTQRLRRETVAGIAMWTDRPHAEDASAGVFDGIYGRVYDGIIRTRPLRRLVFTAWGSAEPLLELDNFVADLAETIVESADRVVADVPCGAGVLQRLLSGTPFRGTVVEVDIARQMLKRAVELRRELDPQFRTLFLRADALSLPLNNRTVDVVFSLNGLHVVGDHQRFLSELVRVLKAGGTLWLISPVDNRESLRSRAILAAAERIGVTPTKPPTVSRLGAVARAVGLEEIRSYGGESITGRVFRRVG